MKNTTMFRVARGWLVAAGLLCAGGSWGDPVPTGPISDYLVHCHSWMSFSAEACTRLADRLAVVAQPTRADRLALLVARGKLGREDDVCAGLAAITADHPDYAYALYFRSYCVPEVARSGEESSFALLKRAAEIEPDNYLVLQQLVWAVEGLHPERLAWAVEGLRSEAGRLPVEGPDADPATLASWQAAMYEAGKARAVWWRTVLKDAKPDALPTENDLQATVWGGPLRAARYMAAAAIRDGDLAAAEAIRATLRRDLGLDDLDYGPASARTSLALACQPALYGSLLRLEEYCVSGVEKLAGRASDDGQPLPGYVLKVVDFATSHLRREACAASQGHGGVLASLGECWPELTETAAVARLRAVLEHHGGAWSSEHHRVHAQGFLGGDDRLDGLRAALRADADNTQARCELATALDARGNSAGVAVLGDVDPECLNRVDFAWGDISAPL